jgi:hypothetical protein
VLNSAYPYLQFSSAEEEEAYRKREAERDEARKRALAMNTPEATARAAKLVLEQIDDAGQHGANRSPEFAKLRGQVEQSLAELRQPDAPDKDEQPSRSESQQLRNSEALDDIMAALKSAGVQTANASDGASHNVPKAMVSGNSTGRA